MAENGLDGQIIKARSFKKELLEAKNAYEGLLLSGAPTAQIEAAAQAFANIRDEADDANDAVKALTGAGKFQAVTKSISAVAGGFTAIQGAIGLAGGKSEDFEKTIQKVQSAMALTQGLTALEDAGNAFGNLKKVAIDAAKGIKVAIGSTGIGLLVIALGAIVAYWDDIKEAVSGVSSEQDKLNKLSAEDVASQTKKLEDLGSQDNILKLQGKSEKEILKLKMLQTDEVIQATEIQIQNQEATKKSQIEASQRNKDILSGILKFISAPLAVLLKSVDGIGKVLGKDFGLEEKLYGGIAKLVFDPEGVEKEADKTIKETQKGLTKLKNDRAGFQLQINSLDKKDSDDKKAKAKENSEEAKKEADKQLANEKAFQTKKRELLRINELAALKDEKDIAEKKQEFAYQNRLKEIEALEVTEKKKAELRVLALTENENALAKIREDYAKKQKELRAQELEKAFTDDTTALEKKLTHEKYLITKGLEEGTLTAKEARDKERAAELQALQDRIDAARKAGKDIEAIEAELYNFKREQREIDRQANLDAINAGLEFATKAANATQEISDALFAGKLANVEKGSAEEEAIQKKQFDFNKKMQLAMAIIDGAKAATASLSLSPVAIGPVPNPAGIASLAFVAITTAATLAKIAATQFQSGGSKSAGAKFSEGGLLNGNSHDRGGIRNYFGEMEGGEYIVNKNSSAAFLPLLERINELGNKNSSMPEQTTSSSTQQPIIKTYVVASDVSSQQEADKRIADLAAL